MKILDFRKEVDKDPGSKILDVTVADRDGTLSTAWKEIIRDRSALIQADGKVLCELSATPTELPELAAGWLRSHELISGVDDIEEMTIKDADGDTDENTDANADKSGHENADEYLSKSENVDEYVEESECENAGILIDVSLTEKRTGSRSKNEKMRIDIGEIFELVEERRAEGELRKKTDATHSCRLIEVTCTDEPEYKIVHCSDDVGRHAAVDKAIGYGVMNNVDLGRCLLLVSSRISSSMIRRAAACGIKAVISIKYQTTVEAVLTAREKGIMLAGMNRDGELIIYEGAGLI